MATNYDSLAAAASTASTAALASPPSVTIARCGGGSTTLVVEEGAPLASLAQHTPFLVRIAIGSPRQEDLAVSHASPVHGTGADGRYELRLAAPTRYAHPAGDHLRYVERQRVLSTRFVIQSDGDHLFDAFVRGPAAPHLHDDDEGGTSLRLENMTRVGHALLAGRLHQHRSSVLTLATRAVHGWAAFSYAPDAFAAQAVAVQMSAISRQTVPLSRGSSRPGEEGGDSLAPLVAVIDLGRQCGYWSNVSEEGSGWVVKLHLHDLARGSYWRAAEELSSSERRLLGVGPIGSFETPLHARYTRTSEHGEQLPDAANEATSLPDGGIVSETLSPAVDDQNLTLVEYAIVG